MQALKLETVSCPYCGERIEVLIDKEEIGHQYIEDCQVCCKPIVFSVYINHEGEESVSAHDENESF